MKELEVYVRSSPLGKTDFHWRKIENGESILGYPQILEQRIIPKKTGGLGTIEYLINYQKLSFLLMRHSQQLLFLVAGIEALEERSNQLGSTIYNAVAWVSSPDESNSISPKNELTLRHLAARSLLSFVDKDKDPEFLNTINEAINFKGLEEFSVDFDKIDQLTNTSADKLKELLPNLEQAQGDLQIWEYTTNNQDNKINDLEIISLSEKIIQTPLPTANDLAILTKVNENEIYYKGNILPNKIEEEKPVVSKLPEIPLIQSKELASSTEEDKIPVKKTKIRLRIVLILFSLLLLLILSILLLINQEEEEQPQNIPVPQTLTSPKPEITVPVISLPTY
ncbi:hypothetical protein L2E68_13690 [Planktothrix agardhii 1029]|uniref:Uncharacterized protein n=1 Tax=Planktothrix agardhii (strain NIVA-CYA 126/8) TaxID=388467 RepID=A0A073CF25_PLAA1|nr:hypothetical protein [Planktothrix agardhii]KEI66517.1 hypothetical protein A19Y_1473 [Planktothrix agardhii NIVA-CYA 126/8]MCB8762560.1 hypothetical protein [Planktothrix agardhii 1809]MCB8763536.1 hypothetical protein [Planktothrix agardhii 1809]MCB8781616.1 hypothetical protein [Planktothrix agardhii 1808]MCF3567198.1 hypothetical protein [Planktothrix agardhii 1807]